MPNRGPPTAPARHSPRGEDQVQMPAIEPTTSLCEIAWRDRSLSLHREHPLQLRKHTRRAMRSAKSSRSREGPAPRAETGTIAHSCANVWQAEFADLNSAHRNKNPLSPKSERASKAVVTPPSRGPEGPFQARARRCDHQSPIIRMPQLLRAMPRVAATVFRIHGPIHSSGAQFSLSYAWLSLGHKHFPVRLTSSSNFVPGPKAPMSTLWPKIASNSPFHFFQWAR